MYRLGGYFGIFVALEALIGYLLDSKIMASLVGNIAMGLVSITAILTISLVLITKDIWKWSPIFLLPVILFSLAALYAHNRDFLLYDVPEGSHGFFSPASSTALLCYVLMSLSLFYHEGLWKTGPLWIVLTLSLSTILGYFLSNGGAAYLNVGAVSMSFPSALALAVMSSTQLLELSGQNSTRLSRLSTEL